VEFDVIEMRRFVFNRFDVLSNAILIEDDAVVSVPKAELSSGCDLLFAMIICW
jgi:hypothetical protein